MIDRSKNVELCILGVAAATHVGRVRTTNEDAYLVSYLGTAGDQTPAVAPERRYDTSCAPVLISVSDGMGGAAAGEVASALTIEALRRSLPPTSPDWTASLRQAVERANRAVWTEGHALSARRGMGATLTAVCVHGVTAHIAEVGDSRAYLLRRGRLSLLTHDQSYVQLLVDAGAISPAEAASSPLKNILTQAMGQSEDVRVEIGHLRLETGDVILVCCDGLSNEVTADTIRGALETTRPASAACARLIELANDNGGRDNITVVLAVVEQAAGDPTP